MEPRLLTLQQAATYIGHSSKWLYSRTGARGKDGLPFKPVKVGKRVFFDKKQIDQWIDGLVNGNGINQGE